MAKTVSIGLQGFEKTRKRNVFLVDKTMFIKEWWEEKDEVLERVLKFIPVICTPHFAACLAPIQSA